MNSTWRIPWDIENLQCLSISTSPATVKAQSSSTSSCNVRSLKQHSNVKVQKRMFKKKNTDGFNLQHLIPAKCSTYKPWERKRLPRLIHPSHPSNLHLWHRLRDDRLGTWRRFASSHFLMFSWVCFRLDILVSLLILAYIWIYVYSFTYPSSEATHAWFWICSWTKEWLFIAMDSHSNVCLDLKVCGRTTKAKCGNGRRAVGTVDNDFQESIESNIDSHRHRQTSNCIFEAVLGCTQLSCLAPHFLSFFLAVRPASCSFTCPKESGEMGNVPLG